MVMEEKSIQLFENKQIRTKWDEETEKWYFSVIDIIDVLTESVDAKRYWSVLKVRLKKEGAEPTTICSTLKIPASDGKMRLTDVADQEQMFRLIQSIPSLGTGSNEKGDKKLFCHPESYGDFVEIRGTPDWFS